MGRPRRARRSSAKRAGSPARGASTTSSRCTAKAPGNCFDGMTTLGRARVGHDAHPARSARRRRHVPASVGVHRAGADDRPRVARAARPLARRGLVRARAPRARDPVPADRRTIRPARGRARDRHATDDRRTRVVRGRARVARRRADAAASPSSVRTRRSGSAPTARSADCRRPRSGRTCGTPSPRPSTTRSCRSGSTSSPRRRAATRRRSAGPGRSRSPSRGTKCGATSTRCAHVGVSYLVCSWPGEGEARVGEFAERVMSEFTE